MTQPDTSDNQWQVETHELIEIVCDFSGERHVAPGERRIIVRFDGEPIQTALFLTPTMAHAFADVLEAAARRLGPT